MIKGARPPFLCPSDFILDNRTYVSYFRLITCTEVSGSDVLHFWESPQLAPMRHIGENAHMVPFYLRNLR